MSAHALQRLRPFHDVQGLQETLCLDCAMATSGRKGCTTSIMCSRHIPALEETARWLEQHSLLKNRSQGKILAFQEYFLISGRYKP